MKLIKKKRSEISNKESLLIDEFIDQNNGLVFHETTLNKIAANHFNTELQYYLAYSDNQELIGICPVHILKKGILKRKFSKILFDIPYGGWVYNNKANIKDLIKTILILSQRESFNYYSNIIIYETELNILQNEGYQISILKTPIVALNEDEEYIWNNIINSKKRNKIRKAINSGISVVSKQNFDGLDEIWPLINILHTRLGFNNLTKNYYYNILKYYFLKNQANVLLAIKNDKVISGLILIGNKHIMHYWKSASDPEVKNEGQGELLQWKAIQWSKSIGCNYYDLCVVEKERLPHIYEFKTGISKNLVDFYSLTKKSMTYRIINKIQSWILRGPYINSF